MDKKKPKKKLRLIRKQEHLPSRLLNGAEIVLQHPQLNLIVEWMREGSSCASIARYMKKNGMISQSDRTYTDYLLAFKRVHPQLLQDNNPVSLDDIVSANKPPVSIHKELNRMYRLQKTRLAVATQQELSRGTLNKDGHRELSVAHDYLQTMAKMGGSTLVDSGVEDALDAQQLQRYDKEVQAKLIAIKQDERTRERLHMLVLQFTERMAKDTMKSFSETGRSDEGGDAP